MSDPSTCPHCDAINKPGRQYCCSCGLALGCPGCGYVNDPDDAFCGGCGRQLQADLGDRTSDEVPATQAGRILGFELSELRAEAGIEVSEDMSPAGGSPIHMNQDELDELFNPEDC